MSTVESVSVSVFIMVVVFLVLVCLCFCISLFLKLITNVSKKIESGSKLKDKQTGTV